MSRIGENAEAQRYCVEAKQWQAALQEARKLRGDAGPLSKFSIELMDDGYRAVDPKLKIRYVVNKAPASAQLTGSNGAAEVATPGAAAASPASVSAPTERMSGPPVSAPAKKKKPSRPNILVPHDEVPPAPPAPSPGSGAPRVSAHPTQRSLEAPKPPAFQLVRKREEEPTEKTPIAYREYAYAVTEGTDVRQAEVLLWARFREVRQSLEGRPSGQFVQLAVFDHMFERRPLRPPLATLAWKDWRGDPVVQFPGSSAKPASPPAGALPEAKAAAAAAPAAPAPAAKPAPAPAPAAKPAPAPAPAAKPAPAPAAKPAPVQAPPAPSSKAVPAAAAPPAPSSQAAAQPAFPAPVAAPPPARQAPPPAPSSQPAAASQPEAAMQPFAVAPSAPSQPALAPQPLVAPPPSAPSQPGVRRHKADEDLIGELFETMHELHFMQDLVAGSEFVLRVLENTLPCEAALVHVFDINTQHYVVVRASAPGAAKVIMHRVPDGDSLFEPVMRRQRSLKIDDAANDPRVQAERWKLAGVEVHAELCGPVQLNRRYLGMVELVNPQGGGAFYESECNALDYICEQFAEFLAAHPIVLDAELILAKP